MMVIYAERSTFNFFSLSTFSIPFFFFSRNKCCNSISMSSMIAQFKESEEAVSLWLSGSDFTHWPQRTHYRTIRIHDKHIVTTTSIPLSIFYISFLHPSFLPSFLPFFSSILSCLLFFIPILSFFPSIQSWPLNRSFLLNGLEKIMLLSTVNKLTFRKFDIFHSI